MNSGRSRLSSRTVVSALLLAVAVPLAAADVVWTGGGADTHWSNPDNWGGTVPGSDDTALFTDPGAFYAELTASAVVGGLVVGNGSDGNGTVDVNNWVLTVNGPVTVAPGSTLHIDTSGRLQGNGDHAISGTLEWRGGYLSGSGTTTVSGTLDADGASTKTLVTRELVLTGGGVLSGGGALWIGSSLAIAAGAELDVTDDTDIQWSGTVTVLGTLRKSGGAGTTQVAPQLINDGQVLAESGKLESQLGAAGAGDWEVASGAVLELGHATKVEPSGSVSGEGDVIAKGRVTVEGAWSVTGPVTASFSGANQLAFSGAGPYSLPVLSLIDGGALGGAADVTVTQSFTWQSGLVRGGGRLILGPGATGTIALSSGTNLHRELVIEGAVTLSGVTLFVTEEGSISIVQGGELEVLDDIDLNGVGHVGTALVHNLGTLRKTGGGVGQLSGVRFENHGSVSLEMGTWETVSGGQYVQADGVTMLDGGTLATTQENRPIEIAGGVLAGFGTLLGDVVTIDGVIAPGTPPGATTMVAGALEVSGSYTQQGGIGGVDLDLGGPTPILEHDLLEVVGDADLSAARVRTRAVGGYTPGLGAVFDVVTSSASLTGPPQALAVSGFAPGVDGSMVLGTGVLSVATVPALFLDGFESGDTSAWD